MESVFEAAHRCLLAALPAQKLAATQAAVAAWRSGRLGMTPPQLPAQRIERPGRPQRPQLVSPRQLPQRGLGAADGRAALDVARKHLPDLVVSDLRMPRQDFRQLEVAAGADRLERPPHLCRRLGLHVERIKLAWRAEIEDHDAGALILRWIDRSTFSGGKVLRQPQPDGSEGANLQKITS